MLISFAQHWPLSECCMQLFLPDVAYCENDPRLSRVLQQCIVYFFTRIEGSFNLQNTLNFDFISLISQFFILFCRTDNILIQKLTMCIQMTDLE